MYLDYNIKNSTLGQWEAAIPAATDIFSKIFGGGKTEAQKKVESTQRRVGRAKDIVDSLPTLNRFPTLKAKLYSYLANCMPTSCPCEPLAAYIAQNFPLEVGHEIMRLSPSIMGKVRAGQFITNWQRCLSLKLTKMKPLGQLLTAKIPDPPVLRPPAVQFPVTVQQPPTVTTKIAPLPPGEAKSWWEKLLERTATPTVPGTPSPPSAPVIQAGVGRIDPQTLLIAGGVGLGAILLSQGKKRR